MENYLRIISGGNTTSIQDNGRYGYQDQGIPPSGVVNYNNLIIANSLVGNDWHNEVLEIFLNGPIIDINVDEITLSLVASSKSNIEIINKNLRIYSGRSINVKQGDQIKINLGNDCLVGTLAFSGSLKIKRFLGSKSTNSNIGIGGLNGNYLNNESILLFEKFRIDKERILNTGNLEELKIKEFSVIPGYQEDLFDEEIIRNFYTKEWIVTNNINRMGILLEGEKIKYNFLKNIYSDGNITGSIQIPPKGSPIILLPDRGTTGGYPKIASIISSDLYKLSYLKPGKKISFNKVNYEYAIEEKKIQNLHLKKLIQSIKKI